MPGRGCEILRIGSAVPRWMGSACHASRISRRSGNVCTNRTPPCWAQYAVPGLDRASHRMQRASRPASHSRTWRGAEAWGAGFPPAGRTSHGAVCGRISATGEDAIGTDAGDGVGWASFLAVQYLPHTTDLPLRKLVSLTSRSRPQAQRQTHDGRIRSLSTMPGPGRRTVQAPNGVPLALCGSRTPISRGPSPGGRC